MSTTISIKQSVIEIVQLLVLGVLVLVFLNECFAPSFPSNYYPLVWGILFGLIWLVTRSN